MSPSRYFAYSPLFVHTNICDESLEILTDTNSSLSFSNFIATKGLLYLFAEKSSNSVLLIFPFLVARTNSNGNEKSLTT